MGLNWSYKLVRTLLILMIGISIFLSSLIWAQSSRTSVGNYADNVTTTIKAFAEKEVFVPVRLVRHLPDDKLLYTNRESIMQKVTEELSTLDYDLIKQEAIADNEAYREFVAKKGTIELMFGDLLNLPYFLSAFDFKIAADDHLMFNRMILNYQDETLSFLNDEDYTIWTSHYQGSLASFRELILDKNTEYFEVESKTNFGDRIFYNITSEIKLKKYSYILETQAYSVFSKLLFEPGQDIIPSDDASKNLYFSTAKGQSLAIENQTGVIKFENPAGIEEEKNSDEELATNIYGRTFDYLNKLGKMIGNIHYFETNNSQVVYRQYVEGYPIFSDFERGRVTVTESNQETTMKMNQNTILVPIPLDEEVQVANTNEVVEQLRLAGVNFDLVSGMQIGYTWLNEPGQDKQIVNLSPEWYIKYQGGWETVSTVIQSVTEGGEV
ncbi:YycH family regulatory protein [Vagococcus zengguangii]|uniref:Regulatory protein YycH domain-containing protein n=1 Tax=Vagococcus zengguangii TaxID=2571750 RepID=A0A4D7CV74_9ENTE|nr:two-component system activity regulator YycH [Vagococcus zengguangii]QCI87274.1 hypothetical protein FA707_10185 [Vagococcus zengguangii]